ncbi:MAG TPA: TatD family hydrolase [Prolixibacteraceae bacterium]|nr:TatD family hydrolase [Prolixibacteraceae bacterium]HPS13166.1 TatD family hydrolase [Prolixibacteraceae bacterium]
MIEFINVHTHHPIKEDDTFSIVNIQLPSENPGKGVMVSVGWHPWDIENIDLPEIEQSLEKKAGEPNVLLVGECGIDRTIHTSVEKQLDVLMLHFKTAIKHQKALMIHCVKAYSDIENLLKSVNYQGKIVFHDFNGNQFQIEKLLNFDSYFSLGRQFMNPNSTIRKAYWHLPVDRLLFETDDSDLRIKQLYDEYIQLTKIDSTDLKDQIKLNFNKITGLTVT